MKFIVVDTLNMMAVKNLDFKNLHTKLRRKFPVKDYSLFYVIKYHNKQQYNNWQQVLKKFLHLTGVLFILGDNGTPKCGKNLKCPNPDCPNHAACGFDDFLVILVYNFLKIHYGRGVYILSEDKYKDYRELVGYFKKRNFMERVTFMGRIPGTVLDLVLHEKMLRKPDYANYISL